MQLLLEDSTIDVNVKDSYGNTPLALAAEEGYGDVEIVSLKHKDIRADSRNSFNVTPLALAANAGLLDIVSFLLERRDVYADSRETEDALLSHAQRQWDTHRLFAQSLRERMF